MNSKILKIWSKQEAESWVDTTPEDQKTFGLFGHVVEKSINGDWVWKDTQTSCSVERGCGFCGLMPLHGDGLDKEHPADPCLGKLPGVHAACCGHGTHPGHITFENGVTVLLKQYEIRPPTNELLSIIDCPTVEVNQPTFTVNRYGYQTWKLNGEYHRTDGPALILNNGSQFWYLNGKCYRTDGPAIVWADGSQWWFLNGKQYFDNKSFQKAAKLTDEEMVIMIIKHGDVS